MATIVIIMYFTIISGAISSFLKMKNGLFLTLSLFALISFPMAILRLEGLANIILLISFVSLTLILSIGYLLINKIFPKKDIMVGVVAICIAAIISNLSPFKHVDLDYWLYGKMIESGAKNKPELVVDYKYFFSIFYQGIGSLRGLFPNFSWDSTNYSFDYDTRLLLTSLPVMLLMYPLTYLKIKLRIIFGFIFCISSIFSLIYVDMINGSKLIMLCAANLMLYKFKVITKRDLYSVFLLFTFWTSSIILFIPFLVMMSLLEKNSRIVRICETKYNILTITSALLMLSLVVLVRSAHSSFIFPFRIIPIILFTIILLKYKNRKMFIWFMSAAVFINPISFYLVNLIDKAQTISVIYHRTSVFAFIDELASAVSLLIIIPIIPIIFKKVARND